MQNAEAIIRAGPNTNLRSIVIIANFVPHAMILLCDAMKRPVIHIFLIKFPIIYEVYIILICV